MKLLSRLFRKSPLPPVVRAPTQSERLASLQAAPVDVIASTALGDEDVSLRVAAVRALADGAALRGLAGLDDVQRGASARTPPAVRQAALLRLAQLIDTGEIDFATFCSEPAGHSQALNVAALCSDSTRMLEVLARIDDPAELASLVVESPSSRVRQAAAAAIDDPAWLHDLLPRVRGRDKTVYKLIRQKCDALIAAQRKADDVARETAAVCASLERHGARSHDPLYAATLEALTTRWRALPAGTDPLLQERGEQALQRCLEVVAAHEREMARQAAEQAAAHDAARAAHEARERTREDQQRAAAAQAEADAQALAATIAARAEDERVRAEQRATAGQALSQVGGLIRLCSSALHAGNTRKAARFRQGIEEAMQAAPALPDYLARSLLQLDERLNELRQWKDYVVAPKRIELIEEMEALVGAQEEPEALAEHIRALQQEWRTINKGIASDASAEAERFQQAYRAAFKPCEAHFAAQAVVRRGNLEARRQVLERLQAFIASQDNGHADYHLVMQVLREAPREWHSHSPVDREASRNAENEFRQSMDRLRQVLNAWHERNAAEKSALIAQVRHLSSIEDTTQAIDGVVRLQALWKESGPVQRDQAQALWDEFRTLCDAVYQRREQAYAQYAAGLEAARASAVALCEQVEQAGIPAAAERPSMHSRVREWHDAFEALGELPRTEARGLRDRFDRAVARFEAGLAQLELRSAAAAESNLFEAARHIRAYERALMQEAANSEHETLRAAAETFMTGVQGWPKGGLQVLKQALARAGSVSAADVATRERALRAVCIRSEILSSTPTPAEDDALRRDYQLRLLMEGLGQVVHADDRDWDAMVLEWVGIGAVAPDVHEALELRFRHALANRPANDAAENSFQKHDGRDKRSRGDTGERAARRDGRGRPQR
jgi:hypothetical protein